VRWRVVRASILIMMTERIIKNEDKINVKKYLKEGSRL
jgi:hypothetical protein